PDRLPLSAEVRAAYSEGREAYLRSLYLGASGLGLVLAGAAGRRRRLWLLFLFLAVTGALLALGRHTPAYAIATFLVPPLGAMRFPAKAMILTAFAWAAMAGIGLDAWRRDEGGAGARAAIAVVLAVIAAWPAALDVVRPQRFQRIYVYDYFEAGAAPRYLGHRSAYLTQVPQEDWPVPWLDALALRTALYPSVIGNWRREGSFDRDALGLYP